MPTYDLRSPVYPSASDYAAAVPSPEMILTQFVHAVGPFLIAVLFVSLAFTVAASIARELVRQSGQSHVYQVRSSREVMREVQVQADPVALVTLVDPARLLAEAELDAAMNREIRDSTLYPEGVIEKDAMEEKESIHAARS